MEQAMKVIERIADSLIRQLVTIDESQFGFVPGRGTTDAIFVFHQLQEKYLTVGNRFIWLSWTWRQRSRKMIWGQLFEINDGVS